MNMYQELARMQHFGQEEMAEELERHLRCWGCDAVLSDRELEKYGNLCGRCEERRVGGDLI